MRTCFIGYELYPYAEEDEPSNKEIDFNIKFYPILKTVLNDKQYV
jgi:hypothetical protein